MHTRDNNAISRINSQGDIEVREPELEKYTTIDESFLASLQMNQWKRENGITELIPIAVVHQR